MKNVVWQMRFLWMGVFISNVCFTLILPFIPLHLYNLGLRENIEIWSSIIVISSYVGATISAPVWGSLSDRFGYKAMIIRAGFANGIIYILCAIAQGPVQLIILRTLYGLNSGFMPAANALVTEISKNTEVGKNIGNLQAAVIGGQLLGPLIGGVIGSFFTISSAFLIAGSAMVINTVFLLFFIEKNKKVKTNNHKRNSSIIQSIKSAFKYKGLSQLLLIGFLFQVSAGMLFPVLATYLMDLRIENLLEKLIKLLINDDPYSLLTGIVFSVPGIIAFFVIEKWAKRGNRVGYMSNIKLGLLFGTILSYLTFFVSGIALLIFVRAIQGIFTASIIPALSTLIAQNASDDYKGTAFSLFNSVRSMGSIFGPLLGGIIAFYLSEAWVFVGIGFVLSTAFGVILLKNKNQETNKKEAVM